MELGVCPRCGTPYTASDVVGLGILRARPASDGGPRLEYRCAGCRRVIVLVPHGDGRYAPPGSAPPPAVPEEARRPTWVGAGSARGGPREGAPTAGPPPVASAREREPRPPPGSGSPPSSAPPAPEPSTSGPLSALEACTILGVGPSASRADLERAFRSRSLACHPDKVAHLDPEFVALAESKFKRLLEAYRLLLGE